ncbi:MAG: hypothetical protein ACRCXT_00605 [Paraclostridium sp.]
MYNFEKNGLVFFSDAIPEESRELKKRWIDECEKVYYYIIMTMGNYILELPYSSETSELVSHMSSDLSMRPCRDGLLALRGIVDMAHCSSNRILRALLDLCNKHEQKWSDSTTLLIMTSIILTVKFADLTIDECNEVASAFCCVIEQAMTALKKKFNSKREEEEAYIRTSISVLPKNDIEDVVAIFKDSWESSEYVPIGLRKNASPEIATFKEGQHIVAERNRGSKYVSHVVVPHRPFYERVHALVCCFPLKYDELMSFIAKNMPFIEYASQYNKYGDIEHRTKSIVLISGYVDVADHRVEELCNRYKIALLFCPHLVDGDITAVVSSIFRTTSLPKLGVLSEDEILNIKPVNVSVVTHNSGAKIVTIHENISESLPDWENYRNLFVKKFENSNKSEAEKEKITFILNLLNSSSVDLFLRYPTDYEYILYYEKLNDIVGVRQRNLIAQGTIPSIYYVLSSNIMNEYKSHCSDKVLPHINSILDILVSSVRHSFSVEQLKNATDLYASTLNALKSSCDFALMIRRCIFVAQISNKSKMNIEDIVMMQ